MCVVKVSNGLTKRLDSGSIAVLTEMFTDVDHFWFGHTSWDVANFRCSLSEVSPA
jgi:hypothetical protein